MIDRRMFGGLSIFRVFKELIDMELKEIEDYINETSIDLAVKQRNLSDEYEKANLEIYEEDEFDPRVLLDNEMHKYFTVFPIYTFNPILLSLYGQFEAWLKKLCDFDQDKGFTKIRVSDLAGSNYIEKSKKYIELVAEIDLSGLNSTWKKITDIQKIRNCIAHNRSNILKNKQLPIQNQELYSVLKKDTRIELDENTGDFYIQDEKFLIEVISLLKVYLHEVIDKLQSRKVVAKNMRNPYDNTLLGQENAENLLKEVILGLNSLDDKETISDGYDNSDLKTSIRLIFERMTIDSTKLYSFFSNGKWDILDSQYIINERENGLVKIKSAYRI